MRFRESIRSVARRWVGRQVEHACDHLGGMAVCRAVFRSIAAVLVGWLIIPGGYVVTMVVIALFNREAFKPAMHYPVAWWSVSISMGLIYSVVGGFVTGAIAGRREITHAIGLVLLGMLVSLRWPGGHTNTISAPPWYSIAEYLLMPSCMVLGGWLRMKQRTLLERGSAMMIRVTERVQFLIAVLAAFATFVLVLCGTGSLGIVGLTPILDRAFGEQHPGNGILPCFLAFLLSGFLSRCVFKRIVAARVSPPSDGVVDDRMES
jgi:hypothetical protein